MVKPGGIESPWEIPRIPASAGAMIFDRTGRLLILKPTYKKGWTIPGGQIEETGESPWQGCQRETLEECGLEILQSLPEEFRDLGDRVLVFGRLKGRGKGSGAPVDTPYTGIFDFRGDKIWRSRVYLDRAEGLKAGLSPPDSFRPTSRTRGFHE
jgi:8-oxo-dGTP pyrophosphatase MutT (NUDIX family)